MAVEEGFVSYGKSKAGMFADFETIGEAGDCIREGMKDFREEGVVYRGVCGTFGRFA